MGKERSGPFGDLLRQHRLRVGLTQQELAEQAGLSVRAITTLERGERQAPRKATLHLLAAALQLQPDELTRFEDAARRRTPLPVAAFDAATSSPSSPALPPLAGREREMHALQQHLAGEGPSVLFLSGEPGIGKSRLLAETIGRAKDAGWRVLQGGCHRGSATEPYAPIAHALQQYIAARSSAGRRADLRECTWLVRLLPELGALAGLETPNWQVAPQQERRLMFQAVERFLSNVAGPTGTLLVLDDLHWAGPDAIELLVALVRPPLPARLRILAAYRHTEITDQSALTIALRDLAAARLASHLEVGPLETDAAQALLGSLLAAESDRALTNVHEVLCRAEGVPFYLVSYAQALQARATNAPNLLARQVPWDIAQSISQRVALLPEGARELLHVAAIATGPVARSTLLAAAPHAHEAAAPHAHEAAAPHAHEAATLSALEAACRARLLVEVGEDAYRPAHDLIGEVVRAGLSAARRTALHRRLADALRSQPGALPVELLAYHYGHGGDVEQAVTYLELAGDQAENMQAHASAEAHYQELVARLDQLGKPLSAARAREKLGAVFLTIGRYDRALELLEEALEMYRAIGDREAEWRTLALYGRTHTERGTPDEGIAHIHDLLAGIDVDQPSRGLATVHNALAYLYFASGRYAEIKVAAERAVQYAQCLAEEDLLAPAYFWYGTSLDVLSCLDEALVSFEHAIALAKRGRDLWLLSHTNNMAAYVHLRRGEFGLGRPRHQSALEVAERLGDPGLTAHMTVMRGMCEFYAGDWRLAESYFERAPAPLRDVGASFRSAYPPLALGMLRTAQGQADAADRHLQEAIAMAKRSGDLQALRYASSAFAERDLLGDQPAKAFARLALLVDRPGIEEILVTICILPLLAWAHLELDETEQAETLIAQSVARASAQRVRVGLADTLRVQGMVALRRKQWPQAEQSFEEALELARAMPYPYAEAKTLYVYGLLHLQQGSRDQACARLNEALTILHRLGEGLYAAKATEALRQVDPRAT